MIFIAIPLVLAVTLFIALYVIERKLENEEALPPSTYRKENEEANHRLICWLSHKNCEGSRKAIAFYGEISRMENDGDYDAIVKSLLDKSKGKPIDMDPSDDESVIYDNGEFVLTASPENDGMNTYMLYRVKEYNNQF